MPLALPESYPQRDVNIVDFGWTGHANQYLSSLRRSIAAICRSDRKVDRFYIGIASGYSFEPALRRRLDTRKAAWGVTDIWMLYQSRSNSSVRWLEAELVEYFRRDPRLMNLASGGGGRDGKGPYYYLYLAHARETVNWASFDASMDDLI